MSVLITADFLRGLLNVVDKYYEIRPEVRGGLSLYRRGLRNLLERSDAGASIDVQALEDLRSLSGHLNHTTEAEHEADYVLSLLDSNPGIGMLIMTVLTLVHGGGLEKVLDVIAQLIRQRSQPLEPSHQPLEQDNRAARKQPAKQSNRATRKQPAKQGSRASRKQPSKQGNRASRKQPAKQGSRPARDGTEF